MEACGSALSYCRNTSVFLLQDALPDRNPYNFMEPCRDTKTGLCYEEISWATAYLNSVHVREALGIPSNLTFEPCNMDLNTRFTATGESNKAHSLDLTYILNSGLRVLLYVGDQDWLCNSRGMQYLANEIEWHGNMPFRSQALQRWGTRKPLGVDTPTTQTVFERHHSFAGQGKQFGSLTFLVINGAGHMVPLDKGYESVKMINDWINGKIDWQ